MLMMLKYTYVFCAWWWVTFFFSVDGDGCQLSWLRRIKIAIGIARGLRYLHTELQPPITIAELSSGAVYLTEDFSPKVLPFGILM